MYIKDVNFELGIYGRNAAVITLKDIDDKDIKEIHDMYLKGSDVTLTKYYKGIDFKTTTTGTGDSGRNLKVEKVIFNEPATIVFWNDNSKTVAVCSKGDKYDAEKGFYICCAKKLFGNDFKAGGKINKALEKAIVQNGNNVPQTGGIEALRKAFEEANNES